MKRILGLAALLGHALSAATGVRPFSVKPGARGANKRPVKNPFTYKGMGPEYSRYWHDPTDEAQRPAIEAAHSKRERRAEKLKAHTLGAWNNTAHTTHHPTPDGGTHKAFIASLNPFYQRPVTE